MNCLPLCCQWLYCLDSSDDFEVVYPPVVEWEPHVDGGNGDTELSNDVSPRNVSEEKMSRVDDSERAQAESATPNAQEEGQCPIELSDNFRIACSRLYNQYVSMTTVSGLNIRGHVLSSHRFWSY